MKRRVLERRYNLWLHRHTPTWERVSHPKNLRRRVCLLVSDFYGHISQPHSKRAQAVSGKMKAAREQKGCSETHPIKSIPVGISAGDMRMLENLLNYRVCWGYLT